MIPALERRADPSGFALLRKPEGITSFQALAPVKRAVGISRVGHAGTLDRFAFGLLVALWGPYSRLAPYFCAGRKRYVGVVRFGAETDTLDPEGRVVAEGPRPERSAIEEALPLFRGNIRQRPPAYSAVHVDGERAYKLALAGGAPEMRERDVLISSLTLESYDGVDAVIALECSAGTYVRSLARDLALACGSRAHLVALERTAIGPFEVEDAVAPEQFDPARDTALLGAAQAASLGLPPICLGEGRERRFENGCKLERGLFSADADLSPAAGAIRSVFSASGRFLGVIGFDGGEPRYRLVLSGGAP